MTEEEKLDAVIKTLEKAKRDIKKCVGKAEDSPNIKWFVETLCHHIEQDILGAVREKYYLQGTCIDFDFPEHLEIDKHTVPTASCEDFKKE